MKKKFMKVALFGVLTLTAGASFVGCKDYDDDISGLNEALAATKSDLTSKETALKASIASLEAAKVDVAAVLASAKTESDKAALKAKEDAIASSLASMKAIEADLQAKIAANTSDIKILNEQVLAADKAFAALSGEVAQIQKMLLGYEGLIETVGKLQSADTRLETEITTLSDTMKKSIEDLQGQITAVTTQIGVLGEGETVAGELSKLLSELNAQKLTLNSAATKEELATANGLIAGNTQKIQDLSSKIDAQLNVLKSLFRSLVTGINFVEGENLVFDLTAAESAKDYIFGKGLTGAIPFTKGDKYTYNATTLIQVSPSTANISSDMITLVRSDGESLSNDLVIVMVEPFNDAITTRGASKGGLWKVSVKLNPTYDKEALAKFVKNEANKQYLFAVAVKDVAAEGEDERIVASPYSLTFSGNGKYEAMKSIATSTVNGTIITALPSPALPIEIGKAINVKVKGDETGVRASYIVLDGTDAEKLEWRKYGITGVDQVLEANEFNLNIANGNADGKTVKFKVYAIDFAGGTELTQTFSVVCGKQNATAPKLNVTLQPSAAGAVDANYDMPKAIAMTSALATTDEDAKNLVGGSYVIEFKTADGIVVMPAPTVSFHKADGTEVAFVTADAAAIKTITAVKLTGIDLQKITNNSSIVGKMVFKNNNGLEVLVVPVTLAKEMPAFPATFSAKSGLLNNGVIKVYPSYNAGGSTYEYMKIFNGLVAAGNPNYTIGYASNKENEGNKVNFNSIPAKTYTEITVDNSLVGSQYTKTIPTIVTFNYGAISSIKDATSGAYINWAPIWGTAFALKFGSIPEESELKVKTVDITYPAAEATIAKTAITYLSVVDKSDLGLEVKTNNTNDIAAIALKTVSKENGAVNEYYTATLDKGSIKFTKVSDQASLKSDVASKLVITITDVFGNVFNNEFAFTVKANQ